MKSRNFLVEIIIYQIKKEDSLNTEIYLYQHFVFWYIHGKNIIIIIMWLSQFDAFKFVWTTAGHNDEQCHMKRHQGIFDILQFL